MYPNGANFGVQLSFDLETVTNFPYWTDFWNDRKGAIDSATKQYVERLNAKCEQYGAKAHYFLVGSLFEDPDVDYLKRTVAAGHAVGNHTYTHVNIKAQETSDLRGVYDSAPWRAAGMTGQEAVRQEVRMTTEAIESRLGVKPKGFRSPGGFMNGLQDAEFVQKMLQDEGFWWISSHYNDGLFSNYYKTSSFEEIHKLDLATMVKAFNASEQVLQPYRYGNGNGSGSGLIELPLAGITDVVAWRGYGVNLGDWLELLAHGVDYAHKHNLLFTLTTHPAVLAAVDPFCQTIDVVLGRAQRKEGGVWLPDLEEVAAFYRDSGRLHEPMNVDPVSSFGMAPIPFGKI